MNSFKTILRVLALCFFLLAGSATIALAQTNSGAEGTVNYSTARLGQGNNTIEVFPNPATDVVKVKISNLTLENVKIEVYNIIGNPVTVRADKLQTGEYKVNVNDLKPGYYLLVVHDETKRFRKTYKFLKN